jgi:uncharacterized repeat protein (TIGR03803 family)
MINLHSRQRIWTVLWLCIATAAAPGQKVKTLVSFDNTNGAYPSAPLIQGIDGRLYGTTSGTGEELGIAGTVFRITRGGTLTTLYEFCMEPNCADGLSPDAGLVQGTNGSFYGTTAGGGTSDGCFSFGCGTAFKISQNGELTTLYDFCSQPNCADGEDPESQLMQAINGNFYGTTKAGGTHEQGTIFKITPSGKLTILYDFCSESGCADGENPAAGLIQGTDGNFYGTTNGGGAHNQGTVFKITPQGALTTLYSFCSLSACADGYHPDAPLIQGNDGNFYGTTSVGGMAGCEFNEGCGTVFKITPQGDFETLHSFDSADGANPLAGLMQATDGNFYGTTSAGEFTIWE